MVVKYRKRHFPGLYCLKKRLWKNSHFWTKTMVYPLWKNVNFSTFLTSCFYSLERKFFVLGYRQRHFPCLYCLKKKLKEKSIFGLKPWVNAFGKMSIFRVFELFFFYSLERSFFPVKYRTRLFLGLYCKKKVWKNNHFWTKTMG